MPALVWALFIAVLCGMPGTSVPHVSWLELLSFDKLVHASLFFVLTTLSYIGIHSKYKIVYFSAEPIYFGALLISIAYGGVLELLQSALFVARSADVYDFFANSFGAIVASIYFNRILTLIKKYIPFI
jgi:VanZ family protein